MSCDCVHYTAASITAHSSPSRVDHSIPFTKYLTVRGVLRIFAFHRCVAIICKHGSHELLIGDEDSKPRMRNRKCSGLVKIRRYFIHDERLSRNGCDT